MQRADDRHEQHHGRHPRVPLTEHQGAEGREHGRVRRPREGDHPQAGPDIDRRPERERRRRLRERREDQARGARLPDARAAEREGAERADVRLLPHEGLLPVLDQACKGGCGLARRGVMAPADTAPLPPRARPGLRRRHDALHRRGQDVPQLDHAAASGTADDQASGAERLLRPLRDRRARPRCAAHCPVPADGPERDRVVVESRHGQPGRADPRLPRSPTSRRPFASSSAEGRQRVLGHRGDGLDGRAGARRAQLPAASSAAAPTRSTTTARTCTWSSCTSGRPGYWVVNTLVDSLSNETMLAIAKGLQPLGKAGTKVKT